MNSSRLEAFSDGVLAIIITIMVLELHTPEGDGFSDLLHSTGLGFLTYVLSFAYVGIYWTNHHHLFQLVEKVNGPVLWANLNLLFWLSLLPMTTDWMDASDLSRVPVLIYGVDLLLAAASYWLLSHTLVRSQPSESLLNQALGDDRKGFWSPILYGIGIAAAAGADYLPGHLGVGIAIAMYLLTGLLWVIPDRRVERLVALS
ncbi:TMEM175 family protein [Propionibacterium freudenreichii]|uniref:TMEM175 family protein n=1 Tax=Propionibacterium freudenreichii TaxID=1744 RepID=UPI000BC2F898|nr:TMEM175 family protein [Propionibacterium freudenreichii]MDK9302727.1 DUF1211 domain-containing protein [Propionibacterium freudenreichii]MDK9321073.1 DUF1211 domain-containing protein [Propionibacterium freudenreichii]MDK9324930.1 DUF1211 domain-containing protein [Propionibacterium freudenreichii]MDK9340365.1 DUF1211 domain-containing protein [Propionibacterium freudenreichii]MDK9649606.1 DUF1211 domain-containing protein [Propionibacterium freudenreichii]